MAVDKYTAISAGFGALFAAKGVKPLPALLIVSASEAVGAAAAELVPSAAGDQPRNIDSALTNIAAAMLAFAVVNALRA